MHLQITFKHLVLTFAGWAFALSAAAQWQWIDKDGRKVFSDRPPTSDIKDKDILTQPGARANATTSAGAPAAPVATAPKLSGKDPELEARKKKLEEDEVGKKRVEEEKVVQAQADNCERAKRGLASSQSGARISTTNAKGEREFMDDNARAAESKRLQSIMASDCK